MSERRRYDRVRDRRPTHVETSDGKIDCTIVNYSEMGILILAERPPSVQTEVTVFFPLPSGEPITLRGTVVWAKSYPPESGNKENKGYAGIKLNVVSSAYLEAVVERRQELEKSGPRRSDVRHEVYHRVRFDCEGTFLTEYTENLSRGGMYLATDRKLKPGVTIQAELDLPGLPEPLVLEGTVQYCLSASEAMEQGRAEGAGIEFKNMSDEARNHLLHYLRRLSVHRTSPARRQAGPLPAEGSLTDYLVPELLLHFHEVGATGVLRVTRKEIRKDLYFKEGELVYIDSPLRSESLSQYLSYLGFLPLEQSAKWFPFLEKNDFEFGKGIIQEGLMSTDTFMEALLDHQEKRATHMFPWMDGTFEFSAGSDWPSHVIMLPLKLERVVFDGVIRWYDASLITNWMGIQNDSVLRVEIMPSADLLLPVDAYALCNDLDGTMTLEKVAARIQVPITHILPIAYALVISKRVAFQVPGEQPTAQPKVPPRISRKVAKKKGDTTPPRSVPEEWQGLVERDFEMFRNCNYFELLGVTPDTPEKEVQVAYNERAAKYLKAGVDLNQIEDRALARKVVQIVSWFRTASQTLLDADAKRRYMKEQKIPARMHEQAGYFEIETSILQAIGLVSEKNPSEAVSILESLRSQYPSHATISAWYGWALFLTDPSKKAVTAMSHLELSANQDPSDPFVFTCMGEIQLTESQWQKAERYFRQALQLQPSYLRAQKGLDRAQSQSTVTDDEFMGELLTR